MTASKAAAVILPATVVALLLLGTRGRRQRRIVLVLVAVFLVGALGVMSVSEIGERMRSHLDHSETGVNVVGRSGAWLATLPMLADHPIAGIGFGAIVGTVSSVHRPIN